MCRTIRQISIKIFPMLSNSRRKHSYVSNPGLRSLCKSSRAAWRAWIDAGRPSLYEEKKASRKLVCQFVASHRVKKERENFQKCDQMFKDNYRLRFKTPSSSTECKHLLKNGTVTSDPTVILQSFRSFFFSFGVFYASTLSSSSPVSQPNLHDMECASFFHDENMDCEFCVDEIESAGLEAWKVSGVDC